MEVTAILVDQVTEVVLVVMEQDLSEALLLIQ